MKIRINGLAFLLLVSLFSCRAQEQILVQKNLMKDFGEVTYIDKKWGYVSVRWECADPPFKNQPCVKFMEYPIYLFDEVNLGDTLILSKYKIQ